MTISVEQVPMAATAALRRRVLRPQWTTAQMVEHDQVGSIQIAALHERVPVACANIQVEPAPWDLEGTGWWRLRGVAVEPAWRRQGLGSAVVRGACDHAALEGGRHIWCNARIGALEMYLSLGWTTVGGEFELAEIGTHVQMWKPLSI